MTSFEQGEAPPPPTVDVIVINYNAGALLSDCIGAVLRESLPLRVIVGDNASTDASLAILESRYGHDPRLQVLRNRENLGFARASNLAALAGCSAYVLFLNPDCIVEPGTLQRLIGFMDSMPNAGMCGCIVRDLNGVEQIATRRVIPDPWIGLARMVFIERLWPKLLGNRRLDLRSEPLPEEPLEVEAISGALMFVRRQAMREVGLLDEQYFLHCEDLDWFVRFKRQGWPIYLVPDVDAVHHKGACSSGHPIRVLWHKHQGMMRFFNKFQAKDYAWPFRALVFVGIWMHFAAISAVTFVRQQTGRRAQK
jgi:GT2 family glycosyltransferase